MVSFSITSYSSSERSGSSSGSETPSRRGGLEHEVSAIGGSLGTNASQASSAQSVRFGLGIGRELVGLPTMWVEGSRLTERIPKEARSCPLSRSIGLTPK